MRARHHRLQGTLDYTKARAIANRKYNRALRMATLMAYGGPVCACCHETMDQFLSLDHIHNNGAAQRRELGPKGLGVVFYAWLKKHQFPPGFQVLCMNCNFGKRMNDGVCPHLGVVVK